MSSKMDVFLPSRTLDIALPKRALDVTLPPRSLDVFLGGVPGGIGQSGGTEEQLIIDAYFNIRAGSTVRIGERLYIINRQVTKLAFYIGKDYGLSGEVTFTIRKVSDDSVIVSKIWGNASGLPQAGGWKEVTFDTPPTINEEVRILCEFSGGGAGTALRFWVAVGDVVANASLARYGVVWVDSTLYDAAYKYTYYLPCMSVPFAVHLPKRTLDVYMKGT